MKQTIEFSKLFRRVGEGESYIPSIVAYAKVPWEGKTEYTLEKEKRVTIRTRIITKWKYALYINLWFVSFNFYWIK